MRSGQDLTDMFFRKLSALPIGRAFFLAKFGWVFLYQTVSVRVKL